MGLSRIAISLWAFVRSHDLVRKVCNFSGSCSRSKRQMSEHYEAIKVTKEDGITFVTFNRPEKRNAMSPQLHHEMDEVLDELAIDPQTSVLVITGAGEAFS